MTEGNDQGWRIGNVTLVLEVAVGEVFESEVRWRKFRGMEERFFWSGGATDGLGRLCKNGEGRC